jgi:hypothetical protein
MIYVQKNSKLINPGLLYTCDVASPTVGMSVLRDVGVVVMVVVHPSSPSFFPLQTYPPSLLPLKHPFFPLLCFYATS